MTVSKLQRHSVFFKVFCLFLFLTVHGKTQERHARQHFSQEFKFEKCAYCQENANDPHEIYLKTYDGRIWHRYCFDRARKCDISGLPVSQNDEVVRIADKLFLKKEYDAVRKCLVSKLPVAGRGPFIINQRSGTVVLEKYLKQTNQCFSCADFLLNGEFVIGRFLCNYCVQNTIINEEQTSAIFREVRLFFLDLDLPVPQIDSFRLSKGAIQNDRNVGGECKSIRIMDNEKISFRHHIRILWGLNEHVMAKVLVHEYAHAIINEWFFEEKKTFDEEGLADFLAMKYCRSRTFPAYVYKFIRKRIDEEEWKRFYRKITEKSALKISRYRSEL